MAQPHLISPHPWPSMSSLLQPSPTSIWLMHFDPAYPWFTSLQLHNGLRLSGLPQRFAALDKHLFSSDKASAQLHDFSFLVAPQSIRDRHSTLVLLLFSTLRHICNSLNFLGGPTVTPVAKRQVLLNLDLLHHALPYQPHDACLHNDSTSLDPMQCIDTKLFAASIPPGLHCLPHSLKEWG